MYTPAFKPEMFTSNPREFGKRHFAREGKWNLGGWAWEEYAAPEQGGGLTVYENFRAEGWADGEEVLQRTVGRGRQRVVLTWGRCKHMEPPGVGEMYTMLLTAGRNGEKDEASVVFRRRGERTWEAVVEVPGGATWVKVTKVTSWGGGDGKGVTPEEFEGGIGRMGWGGVGMLMWKIEE